MANLSEIVKQLKKERDRVEQQLSGLNAALAAFACAYRGTKRGRKRRKMSAKSQAKTAAAESTLFRPDLSCWSGLQGTPISRLDSWSVLTSF
jgi:hypothetical protein